MPSAFDPISERVLPPSDITEYFRPFGFRAILHLFIFPGRTVAIGLPISEGFRSPIFIHFTVMVVPLNLTDMGVGMSVWMQGDRIFLMGVLRCFHGSQFRLEKV